MVDAWLNCSKCGNRFAAFIQRCPRCGYQNSPRHESKASTKVKTSKSTKVAIIAVVLAISVIAIILSPSIAMMATEQPTLSELKQLALEQINKDRAKFNLQPVKLSSNIAAQVHAEDVLKTEQISHWMTNGEKPYMTYSRYDGLGYVAQNVVIQNTVGGDAFGDAHIQLCKNGQAICDKLDVRKALDNGEYAMMYEDKDCCADGHRLNILDVHHTDVSIGIAFNGFFFVMVQNFENNYLQLGEPLTNDNTHIHIAGTLQQGNLANVVVFFDDTPTALVYEKNKQQKSYSLGTAIAGIAPPNYRYDNITTIQANHWATDDKAIDIQFDLTPILSKEGVYTIVTYVDDKDKNLFPVTSYSLFVK